MKKSSARHSGESRNPGFLGPTGFSKTFLPAFAGMLVFLFSISTSALAAPYAFPVPFVEKNPAHTDIAFNELPASGTIRILTVTGEEVRRLNIPQGAGIQSWDLNNASGKRVATGVYIFLVDGDGQQITGKLVVIR